MSLLNRLDNKLSFHHVYEGIELIRHLIAKRNRFRDSINFLGHIDLQIKLNLVTETGNDIVASPKCNYVTIKRNTKNFPLLIPKLFGIRIRLNSSKFNIDGSGSIIASDKREPKIHLKQILIFNMLLI